MFKKVNALVAVFLLETLISACASINMSGTVYMKRSRRVYESPVMDLRNMKSYSELSEDDGSKKPAVIHFRRPLPSRGYTDPMLIKVP